MPPIPAPLWSGKKIFRGPKFFFIKLPNIIPYNCQRVETVWARLNFWTEKNFKLKKFFFQFTSFSAISLPFFCTSNSKCDSCQYKKIFWKISLTKKNLRENFEKTRLHLTCLSGWPFLPPFHYDFACSTRPKCAHLRGIDIAGGLNLKIF